MQKIDYQIDDFMLYCQSKGLTKKTMASYEATLRLFSRYLFDEYSVCDAIEVNESIVRQYIKYIQERGKYTIVSDDKTKKINNPEGRNDFGKKVSATTINNYIRNIKVFFTYLYDQRIIKTNPMKKVKELRNNRKPKDFISDESFIKLLKSMDNSKFHEFRDLTIIQLILDTGMRVGETLSLLIHDIDMNNRSIALREEATKSRKARYVFFSIKMQQELRRWLQYKDRYVTTDYLFPTKRGLLLDVRCFEKNFRDYGKRIGIENIHPHQIRNNFAKRFLMSGGDIYTLSRLLGHSSVTVTERAYLDLTDEDIRKNYQRFSPLANLKR